MKIVYFQKNTLWNHYFGNFELSVLYHTVWNTGCVHYDWRKLGMRKLRAKKKLFVKEFLESQHVSAFGVRRKCSNEHKIIHRHQKRNQTNFLSALFTSVLFFVMKLTTHFKRLLSTVWIVWTYTFSPKAPSRPCSATPSDYIHAILLTINNVLLLRIQCFRKKFSRIQMLGVLQDLTSNIASGNKADLISNINSE